MTTYAEGAHGAAESFGAVALFGGLAAIIVMAIWQFAATRRARIVADRAEEYQRIAGQATRALETAQARLTELTERLDTVQSRVEAMERLLAEVE